MSRLLLLNIWPQPCSVSFTMTSIMIVIAMKSRQAFFMKLASANCCWCTTLDQSDTLVILVWGLLELYLGVPGVILESNPGLLASAGVSKSTTRTPAGGR